jgi:pimeloyl-ACP methyl ester carboxylesterase
MSGVDGTLAAGAVRTTYAGLAAVEVDPAHARGTVLLVAGLTGSKEDFSPLLPLLGAAGWRAVAIDLRGQYESPGPDDPDAYSVDALGRDVLDVVDQLGGPVHLVGHSFGGLVCRSAVIARPEAVLDLVLLCSGPGALGGDRAVILELMKPILAEGGTQAVAEAAAALSANFPPEPAEVQDFRFRRHVANNAVGLLAMTQAALHEPDRVEELAKTGVRVLVAHGVDDDAWPGEVQAEVARRLSAAYEVIPDAAHSPAAENAPATAEVLQRFWG